MRAAQETTRRVVALLNRQEIDFLDEMGKDAGFTTGKKLDRTQIIRALVDIAMEKHLSGEGINSFEKLKERILEQMKQEITKRI